jgi:hypothetical protein
MVQVSERRDLRSWCAIGRKPPASEQPRNRVICAGRRCAPAAPDAPHPTLGIQLSGKSADEPLRVRQDAGSSRVRRSVIAFVAAGARVAGGHPNIDAWARSGSRSAHAGVAGRDFVRPRVE